MLIEEPDPDGNEILDAVLVAVEPFLRAAAKSATVVPAEIRVRIFPGEPTTVHTTYTSSTGPGRTCIAIGTGSVGEDLAVAVGDFVVSGLNRFEAPDRARLAKVLSTGAAVLAVDPDVTFRAATAVVVGDDGRPDLTLFELRANRAQ